MQSNVKGITRVLWALMALGTLCGLISGAYRFRVEMRNRRVEIGLEWQEISTLAQSIGKSPDDTLRDIDVNKAVTTLILQEDTFTQLEQIGAIQVKSSVPQGGSL